MIHQPMGGFQGQASDIEIHAKEILFLQGEAELKSWRNIPARRSKRSSAIPIATTSCPPTRRCSTGLVDKVLASRTEVAA